MVQLLHLLTAGAMALRVVQRRPLRVRYRGAKPTLRNDLTTPDKFRPQRKAGPRAGLFAPNEAPQHDIVISDYLRLLSLYFV